MEKYKTTFETWNKVAQTYQDKFMDMDLYDDTYDLFCRLVTAETPSIFEIGCGPGNITRYILSKRPDFDIQAIDIAPNMIKLAEANNPTARFTIMDCREIDTVNARFDGIVCGFCMPYLSKEDCAKLIKDCSALLNSGGVLYFSTIEGEYEQSGYEAASSGDKTYVYYHQADYLQELLKENGFDLVDLNRKSYPKGPGIISTHMIFLTRKN